MDAAPVVAALGAFLGILFMYSGLLKAIAIRKFAQDLLLFPYVPPQLARHLAVAISAVEITVGVFVMLGHILALAVVIALLSLFSLVAITARLLDRKIPCNCFGSQDQEYLSVGTVVRNVALAALASIRIAADSEPLSLLSGAYGLIFLLLFLATTAAVRNHVRSIALAAR